ncbi:MAG: hypothetical protein QOF37_2415, partial [Thermoleophilaceae bacterium]|nr:hypothetical protein [Thermoleophilaceae bacterium]
MLLVEGPPGAGRSRLLDTMAEDAREEGAEVAITAGTDLRRGVPFGLARQLLTPLVRARGDAAFAGPAAMARPLFDDVLGRPSDGAAESFVEGLIGLVWNLTSEKRPLLVFVDDAQWADDGSLRFIAHLAATGRRLPAGLVIAIREGEPGSPEAVFEHIRELTYAHAIHPAPLTLASAQELVKSELPGAGSGLGVVIAMRSGGNPFLLRELLDAAAAEPAPDAYDIATVVPEAVMASTQGRLGRLSGAARELAMAVAVLEEAPLRRAAALAGLAPDHAEQAADELVATWMLAPEEPLRFEHPLVGEAARASLAPFARARMHRTAAGLLAADGAGPDAVAGQLLRARPDADEWVLGVLRDAAGLATRGGQPERAAQLLDRALAEPPPAEARGELLLELARAEATAGAPTAADRFAEALERLGPGPGRVLAWHALSRVFGVRNEPSRAAEAAERGLEEVDAADPRRDLLLADRLAADALAPSLVERSEAELERLAQAARDGSPPAHPALKVPLTSYLARRGRDVALVADLARAAVAEDPLVDPDARGLAAGELAGALLMVDELELAADLLEAAIERARELGDPVAEAGLRCLSAAVAMHQGRITYAEEALASVTRSGVHGWERYAGLAALVGVRTALARDDLDAAEEA